MTISVQVLPVARNIYDVFLGTGYDNWSRIRVAHWGISVLAGERFSRKIGEVIGNIVHDHPNGSHESFDIYTNEAPEQVQ
jgi:hypothetical protein